MAIWPAVRFSEKTMAIAAVKLNHGRSVPHKAVVAPLQAHEPFSRIALGRS